MSSSWTGRTKCSWCGIPYGHRYGWDGKNIFVFTWDLLTFFWFWWHPHFCSTDCKLLYQQNKGPIGIMRDIDFIKSIIFFFRKPKISKVATDTVQAKTNAEQGFIHTQQHEETDETSEKLTPINQNEQEPIKVESPVIFPADVPQKQTEINEEPQAESTQAIKQPETNILTEGKSEERFYYLREDDRIYTALKFTERKGFFRKTLPSSWILTIGFYALIAFIVLITAIMVTPSDNDTALVIVSMITMLIIPVVSLVIGITKRVKYINEKKKWKECTDSGKRVFSLVLKEFHEMEVEYLKQEEDKDIEKT
jgi:hypothetical protein